MPQSNPWDADAIVPATGGMVITKPADPSFRNKGALSDAELIAAQARAAAAAPQQAAETRIKNAQAVKMERENAEAAADAPTGSSNEIVNSLLQGNLPVGSRSITSPTLLPYIKEAIRRDPTFSAATFAARQKAALDLASAKATGGYLATTGAAIDHSREMEDAVRGLNNPSGWLASHGGAWIYDKLVNDGRPAGTTFDQANRVYSGELTKGIVGSIGSAGGSTALADRQEGERAMSPTMAQDSLYAGMRTGARQLYQKLYSADQLYGRTMNGAHIPNIVTQQQAQQLVHLMRLSDDGKEGAIPDDVAQNASFMALAGIAPTVKVGGGSDAPGAPNGGGSGPSGGSGPNDGPWTIASGPMRTVNDPRGSAIIDSLLRKGASDEQINAALSAINVPAMAPADAAAARAYLKTHPDYKGSFGAATREVPTTWYQRAAASPWGTAAGAAADAAMGGGSDELGALVGLGSLSDLNAKKQAAFGANPKSALAGQVAGTIGAMYGLGKFMPGGIASRFANPQLVGDIAFGAASGAGQDNDNRLLGVGAGAIGGLGGHVLGQGVAGGVGAVARTAPVQRLGGMMFRGMTPPPVPLSAGEQAALSGASRGGIDNITRQLTEARDLGVPMTLADTTPGLRSLGGAAVRRSPLAAQTAEDVLGARGRGQIDRFNGAVTRDLGPVANIPQQSADLTAQARTAAAPLYDQAYAQSVPHTPELASILNTPFGREALGTAKTIAANERRDPAELGFALDADGNTVLNPHPSQQVADHLGARATLDDAQAAYQAARTTPGADMTAAANRVEQARQGVRQAQAALDTAPDPTQAASVPAYTQQTLDYVKRGMDASLEKYRNQVTGKLDLGAAGNAQNDVLRSLLRENDTLNPAYAGARAAYAGPAQARDALTRGQDAFGLTPDELRIQVGSQTPEHLSQMQLGYRSQLVGNANDLRTAGNPFDAASTLGTPAAVDRLGTLYPGSEGVPRLLRQADMERGLAKTNNKIVGNSDTAERSLADKAFGYASWAAPAAIDAGLMAFGHVPVATAARVAASQAGRDAFTMGLGKRAVAKADELAPILFNPDPAANLSALGDLQSGSMAWRDFVARTTPRRSLGMFGRGLGSQAAVAPFTYSAAP